MGDDYFLRMLSKIVYFLIERYPDKKAILSNLKLEKIPWAVSGLRYPTDLPSGPISHWNIRLNSIGRESSLPEVDFMPSSLIRSKVSFSFSDSTNFNFSSSSSFFDFEVFLEFSFDSI